VNIIIIIKSAKLCGYFGVHYTRLCSSHASEQMMLLLSCMQVS